MELQRFNDDLEITCGLMYEDIRSEYIKYGSTNGMQLNEMILHMDKSTHILQHAFPWAKTESGFMYWQERYKELADSEEQHKELEECRDDMFEHLQKIANLQLSKYNAVDNTCDCGKEKFGFIDHITGCPAIT